MKTTVPRCFPMHFCSVVRDHFVFTKSDLNFVMEYEGMLHFLMGFNSRDQGTVYFFFFFKSTTGVYDEFQFCMFVR
uniref:Uncharacterized protein n=1 Tax=Nelumbo nucifera TaxID=4432 RepID=A0A822YU83_NELNU|nr:TPA_asm: hypothetical protein HUJ06_011649 [Nelumbo nucifera]